MHRPPTNQTPARPSASTPDPFAKRPRHKRGIIRLLPIAAAIALPAAYVLSLAGSAISSGSFLCSYPATIQVEETKLATFLGVQTRSLDADASRQLELAEGFGLAILAVSNDSPAQAAGLQPGDVLFQIDDQKLVNPEQIAALVRSYAAGDVVDLTILRDGEMDVLEAELGERELPPLAQWQGNFQNAPQNAFGRAQLRFGPGNAMRDLTDEQRAELDEAMRGLDAQLRQMELRLQRDLGGLEGLPQRLDGVPQQMQELQERLRREFGVDPRGLNGEEGRSRSVDRTRVRMKNDDGEIDYTSGGGVTNVVVKDAGGNVLYDGPMPQSDEAMKDLPADVAERLRKFKVTQKLAPAGPAAPATPAKPAEPDKPAQPDENGRIRI